MKSCLAIVLIFSIGLILLNLKTQRVKDRKPNEGYVTKNSPPESQLALLETGENPPPIAVVNKFNIVLSSIDAKCPDDSRSQIADYVFTGQKILAKNGRKVGLLELANAFDQSMTPDATTLKIQCREVFAALVTLMSPK